MTGRRLPLLGVAAFGTMAALRVCDSLLPSMAGEFSVSTGQAGQTVSAFAIAYGVVLLLYGALGDRYGKFQVIAGATLACSAASLACAMATSLDSLTAFRALAGAAAAGVTPLGMAWIGDQVPYERRQEVLAQLIGATTLGLIAGQSLGGVLADTVGWRSAFWLLALLFAIAGGLMCKELRGRPVARHSGRAETPSEPAQFHRMVGLVVGEPWARRVLGFAFFEGVVVFGGLAFLPSHLHQRFGLPMSWAGAVLVLYGFGGLLYSRMARSLLRRMGETGLARAGSALMCLYFALLALLPHWGWALPACLVGGLGFYMLHSTLQTHATQMAHGAARGTAVTLFSSSLFIGHSLGVAGAAVIVDAGSAIVVFAISAVAMPLIGWRFAAQAGAARRLTGPESLRQIPSGRGGQE